jgi:adenosylcobinamide-GDP ribazoletransferase
MKRRPTARLINWITGCCLLPPLAALQFLTLTPPIVRRAFTPQELGRAVGYFPLIGALLGSVLVGLDHLLSSALPANLTAALLLTGWVIATGALHIDGFLDTLDGLFGGYTPVKRMAIMRDEAVGAFGLAGGVLLLILKLTALTSVTERGSALVLAPTLSRWGMSLSIVLFPYARAEGLGRAMKDQATWKQAILATLTALAIAWLAGGYVGWVALATAGVLTWTVARFVLSRIPGLTGDIYGALGEILELAVLLLLVSIGS